MPARSFPETQHCVWLPPSIHRCAIKLAGGPGMAPSGGKRCALQQDMGQPAAGQPAPAARSPHTRTHKRGPPDHDHAHDPAHAHAHPTIIMIMTSPAHLAWRCTDAVHICMCHRYTAHVVEQALRSCKELQLFPAGSQEWTHSKKKGGEEIRIF